MRAIPGMLCLTAISLGLTALATTGSAQLVGAPEPPPTVEPLGNLQPRGPEPLDRFNEIVKSKQWLIVLGKALFWDSSVGSDGQACASCHFNAGADQRIVNQLNPALRAVPPDDKFSAKTASGQTAQPNIKLKAADFPFHKLTDVKNRQSPLVFDTNDVTSSQGVFQGGFVSLNPDVTNLGSIHDFCSNGTDGIFKINIGGVDRQTRKVEPRNTPTVVNAAFFDRNFWDGRANNVFNGVDPFGKRNVDARIFKAGGAAGLQPEQLELRFMSAASQAVGPPNSDFEMACANRTFAFIGRKMLTRNALAGQKIAWTDSVFNSAPLGNLILGSSASTANKGLKYTYRQLVDFAFNDAYEGVSDTLKFGDNGLPDPNGFTQAEKNFSLFWGLAIDGYERTLISGKTRFDSNTLKDAPLNANPLVGSEIRGLAVFLGQGPDAEHPNAPAGGRCVNCHTGPVFSAAAVPPRQPEERVERMIMGNNEVAFYDGGFYNIGVRPTQNDLGVGARDPFVDKDPLGNPLSFTRQHVAHQVIDPLDIVPGNFDVPCTSGDCTQNARVAVDGAFKVPSLRNVGLTAPYFHNGGEFNLLDVVRFYNRGGNRCGQNFDDTTGSGPLGQGPIQSGVCDNPPNSPLSGRGSNLDADIRVLNLTDQQEADLVAFLLALTDDRVRCHQAPFDHPELIIPNGHKTTGATGKAVDVKLRVREVGKGGFASSACAQNSGNLFGYSLIGTVGSGKMIEVLP